MSGRDTSGRRALLSLAYELGGQVSRTRKGHTKVRLPSGVIVIAAGTSRSASGWRNATATLRRLSRQHPQPGE
jgi:hypothetical protein